MKFRIASMVLAAGLLLTCAAPVYADITLEETLPAQAEQEEIHTAFYLDGEPLYSVEAQCINGVYYVTLASIMPLLDSTAVVEEWDGSATLTAQAVAVAEQTAQAEEQQALPVLENPTIYGYLAQTEEEPQQAAVEVLDTLTLTAQAGDEYLVANGRYLYARDGILTINGSVAVPVRLLAAALKLSVGYDADTASVLLSRSGETGYLEDGESYYDADELYWLSRIIYCESGNQSLSGKIAVANVVLNRTRHWMFPDTVYDVIFQKNQFSPAGSGSIYVKEPNAESVVAAKLALDGATVLADALFFNRTGLTCYASRNRSYITTIGGHSFYA